LLFGQRSIRTERAIDAELLGGHTSLGDQQAQNLSIHHVICTREVQGGVEFSFSNRMVYGWNFNGSSAPWRLPLSTTVQASACVPGTFRTRNIPLDIVGVAFDDRSRTQRATGANGDHIVVQHGGVYDNMADEWDYTRPTPRRPWRVIVIGCSSARHFRLPSTKRRTSKRRTGRS
ncbi:MAG: hypothetical protein ABI939_07360, partial [Anaerolineaceae bacterium]